MRCLYRTQVLGSSAGTGGLDRKKQSRVGSWAVVIQPHSAMVEARRFEKARRWIQKQQASAQQEPEMSRRSRAPGEPGEPRSHTHGRPGLDAAGTKTGGRIGTVHERRGGKMHDAAGGVCSPMEDKGAETGQGGQRMVGEMDVKCRGTSKSGSGRKDEGERVPRGVERMRQIAGS